MNTVNKENTKRKNAVRLRFYSISTALKSVGMVCASYFAA